MQVKAFQLEQKGLKLYVGVLPARTLVDVTRVTVDQWSPSNTQGYQRQLTEKRVAEAAWYLMRGEGWFPTAVLLSVRAELQFRDNESTNGVSLGTLEIPDDQKIWVIDGQHRVAGLRRAIDKGDQKLADYLVPVAIVSNPNKLDEVRLFYLVNSKAKSVPADIADRILQQSLEEKGKVWLKEVEASTDRKAEKTLSRARATNVVDHLRQHCPVWQGFVEVPGEAKPHPKAVKQHTIVTALLEGPFKDPSITRLDDSSIGELLDRYWCALSRVFPEAFDDADSYSIRRTPGVYSLTMIFADVFERCRETRDYSSEKMEEFLRAMNLESNFWHTDSQVGDPMTFGTGMKSLRLLADHLRESLPPLTLAGM